MYEYVIKESQEHVGYAWTQGNCNLVRMGHKHDPHIDRTRACPGYLPVQLMAFDRTSPPIERVFNREKERIDLEPAPDPDEIIRSTFNDLRDHRGGRRRLLRRITR